MTSLSAVSIGPEGDRRIIGYVDDLGGVYDAQQRQIGKVGLERDQRYTIQDARGVVAGSVDASADAGGGHAVYDHFNIVVGSGFAGRFVEASTGQSGVIAINAGRGERAGVISGAALLLLVHALVSDPATDERSVALDRMSQGSHSLAEVGLQQARTGMNQLVEEHKQTLDERQRRAKAGSMVNASAGQRMKTLATVVVEMIPLGLGPYGVGDIVTFVEGVMGWTLDGLRLSIFERLIYFGASAIPVVPARPIVAVYRFMERGRAQDAELRKTERERRRVERSER